MIRTSKVCCVLIVVIILAAFKSQEVNFQNADIGYATVKPLKLSGILAKPAGQGPFPAVVLLISCGGIEPTVSHDWPEYLTGQGYVTLTVDSFGPRHLGKCPNMIHPGGRMPRFGILASDAYGGLDYLATLPFVDKNKVAVMGFSLGAQAITRGMIPDKSRMSGGLDFKAAISMYGRCELGGVMSDEYPFPLLIVIGEKDRAAKDCKYFFPGSPVTNITLPGVNHAFDHQDLMGGKEDAHGNFMEYDADATAKAREFTRDFLTKHLKK